MAYKITVSHKPELTKEDVMEIFQKNFGGKYQIDILSKRIKATAKKYDFEVIKDSYVSVLVGLQQKKDTTRLLVEAYTPVGPKRVLLGMPFFVGLLPGILVYYIVFKPKYKEIESEITAFIRDTPEFKLPG